jgi:hypothetical protein
MRGAGLSGYGDKRLRNKRPGPGGGTRRLHQKLTSSSGLLWGRNRIDGRVKAVLLLGIVSAVIGLLVQVPTIMKWPSLPNYG